MAETENEKTGGKMEKLKTSRSLCGGKKAWKDNDP